MSSFSFKNIVFYIQVLVNLICLRNFGKVIFDISKHHHGKFGKVIFDTSKHHDGKVSIK